MKNIVRPLLIISLLFSMAGCDSMPKLFWSHDEGTGRPDYASGDDLPLDVPPTLIEATSTDTSQIPDGYSQAVAGNAVAVHARQYNVDARHLFSVADKAMASLNIPVTSADLPSGTIISGWIRKMPEGKGILENLLGDSSPKATRHRYILRIFSLQGGQQKSRLEVRILNQAYQGQSWVNTRTHMSDGAGLFGEVELQLGRMHGKTGRISPR
ncbi:hypothetical protein Ga0123461_2384 [Mariprofundus aestuarium]|uniref:Uncharacterized protein n=1 Tax=Mariprofundus aestuarium TaxID=1921086 RepID=A0A2K8L0N0_MARES|nr:hypothetical protein [Mariprofundus aestuarium]ATX80783.1 hypothetical protein Ga0123461_2384 [Mariprofundus aestuarium]